jgi:hypothetical protein
MDAELSTVKSSRIAIEFLFEGQGKTQGIEVITRGQPRGVNVTNLLQKGHLNGSISVSYVQRARMPRYAMSLKRRCTSRSAVAVGSEQNVMFNTTRRSSGPSAVTV